MVDHAADHLKNDSDRGKGSLEPDERKQDGNNSMQGQLPHRNPHPLADGAERAPTPIFLSRARVPSTRSRARSRKKVLSGWWIVNG